MSSTVYPPGYRVLNSQRTKQLNVVVQFAGIDLLFSVVPTYEKIRYGDPRIHYGDPGIVYGGLIVTEDNLSILSLDGGLNISQTVEPEQGRGSVATMSLQFVDKDGIMTRLIAENGLVPQPLANILTTVSLGYANSAFPQDYYKVFRGFITSIKSGTGYVVLELSDANIKRRQTICQGGTTTLLSNINASTTTIPVNTTADMFQQILGPDGSYDPAVTTYIKIDDEYMTYGPAGITGPQSITVLSRGGSHSRGTTAAPHTAASSVTNAIQFQDNVITLALKLMLSGWGGPWATGISATALGITLDPLNPQAGAILFPPGVDAVQDYGLTVGDYVTVSGSAFGNDGTFVINEISDDLGEPNRMVIVNTSFTIENPATTVGLAFRSQYDTFPISCGLKNTPQEVDVTTFSRQRQLLFSSGIYEQQLFIGDAQTGIVGKDTIEGTLFLPCGIYSITRYGQISMAVTLPPIAQQSMIYLTQNNILNPDQIQITRSVNSRRFYNVIVFSFDLRDDGSYGAQSAVIDASSPNPIDIQSVLPINADATKSFLGGAVMIQQRGTFILNRYKKAAFELNVNVNWAAGSLIETGDIVAVVDNGTLKISNFETGVRDLGTQLFEVINRSLNVKEGNASLTLLSGVGYTVGQRYATISPSSIVATGSTNNSIEISDSFGPLYPGDEKKKWTPLIGLPIIVHDNLWTQSATATLTGFSPFDPYRMLVSPSLPFSPPAGYIVDIVGYGTGTNAQTNALYKTLFSFISASLTVVSGSDSTHFTVSVPDAAILNVGLPVLIHNADWSSVSPLSKVLSVDLGTGAVVVETALGFTPSAGMLVEGNGFKDGGSSYLYL